MHCAGDREQRVRTAMTEIGPSVVNGGVTSAIGVLLCLAGQAKMIVMFGVIVLAVVALGLFHGLIVLPATLAIVGDLVSQKSQMVALTSMAFLVPVLFTMQCAWCFNSAQH